VRSDFVRLDPGGEILDVIPAPPGRLAVTCILGGEKLDTLYCTTTETNGKRLLQGDSKSSIEFAVVETPGFPVP
jgi:sugar lactone lactonase YvrE